MSLNGKVAIVSGGSRGIGRAIVLALAARGAKVAFTYFRDQAAAELVLAEGQQYPGQLKSYQVDIKDQPQVKALVGEVVREWGALDLIVNNAGIRKDKTLAFMDVNDWDEVLRTNLSGTFYLTQTGIYYMLKKKQGRVINISSTSGLNGISGQTNYSSTKAGLFGFTRALAKEVAPYGISVNAVAPGGVETDMTGSMTEKEREKLLYGVPMGRMCRPEEVAQVVVYLADTEACPAYLTGTVIALDGGMGL